MRSSILLTAALAAGCPAPTPGVAGQTETSSTSPCTCDGRQADCADPCNGAREYVCPDGRIVSDSADCGITPTDAGPLETADAGTDDTGRPDAGTSSTSSSSGSVSSSSSSALRTDAGTSGTDAGQAATDAGPPADAALLLSIDTAVPPANQTVVRGTVGVDMTGERLTVTRPTILTMLGFVCAGSTDPLASPEAKDVAVDAHVDTCQLFDRSRETTIAGPVSLHTVGGVGYADFENLAYQLSPAQPTPAILRCNISDVSTDPVRAGGDVYACSLRAILADPMDEPNPQPDWMRFGAINGLGGAFTRITVID